LAGFIRILHQIKIIYMNAELSELVAKTQISCPNLPSFAAPGLLGLNLYSLTDDEALDLIGNLTIDMQDLEDDELGMPGDDQDLYNQLTLAYVKYRPGTQLPRK